LTLYFENQKKGSEGQEYAQERDRHGLPEYLPDAVGVRRRLYVKLGLVVEVK